MYQFLPILPKNSHSNRDNPNYLKDMLLTGSATPNIWILNTVTGEETPISKLGSKIENLPAGYVVSGFHAVTGEQVNFNIPKLLVASPGSPSSSFVTPVQSPAWADRVSPGAPSTTGKERGFYTPPQSPGTPAAVRRLSMGGPTELFR